MKVAQLWRYPVKGLRGERLAEVSVRAGEVFPHDRRFAFAHGNSGITPEDPRWALKTEFHMLMHGPDAGLASLTPSFDEDSGVLTISRDGDALAQAKAEEADGQRELSGFLARFLGAQSTGAPRFVSAERFYFGNIEEQVISLINLASVRDLTDKLGTEVSPRRFRGNIYVEGLDPWAERDWVGKTLAVGELSFKVVDETIRCGATVVNPETCARDLNVPQILQKTYGHMFCGVYLAAETGGTLAEGVPLAVSG